MRRRANCTLASSLFTTLVFLSLLLGLPAAAQAQFPIVNSAVVNYALTGATGATGLAGPVGPI